MEGLELGVVSEPTSTLRSTVGALIDRVESVTGHAPLSEHKRMVLARSRWHDDAGPEGKGRHSFGITAQVAGRATPVGYAQVSGDRSRREYAVEVLVDPEVDQPADVADGLLGASVDQMVGLGGGTLRWWVPQATEADDGLALAHGFAPERDLIQMRCRLPLPPSASTRGVSVPTLPTLPTLPTRPFRPGVDEDAWLVTNNRAFASHPEQGHWDRATLVEREQEPWFDPEGFLVLEAEGRMAGSCWTKVHAHATPPMGEIYVIGVDPDFHGRGWGRALTAAGLEWLADQGLQVGMLYVDSDNHAAVSLYRSMGFTEDHVDRSYLWSTEKD